MLRTGTLWKALRDGNLRHENSNLPRMGIILRLAHETARAMEYLHKRRIIHHDLTPQNILLKEDEDGVPHVKVRALAPCRGWCVSCKFWVTQGLLLHRIICRGERKKRKKNSKACRRHQWVADVRHVHKKVNSSGVQAMVIGFNGSCPP